MKKILAIFTAAALMLCLAACGGAQSSSSASQPDNSSSSSAVSDSTSDSVSDSTSSSSSEADSQSESQPSAGGDAASFHVGVIQLAEHPALDAAREGFVDGLVAAGFSADNIEVQNAQGEIPNCAPIATKFVNDKVDLILAVATPAAQAAAQATTTIPILATAVTDFVDSGLVESNDAPGGNVSGTSDMNPINEQADLLQQLVPEAKTVGILYCSAEDNSILQADLAEAAFTERGLTVSRYTCSDVNDIQPVTTKAVGEVDVLYVPTDNLFAENMPTAAQIAEQAKIPVICGEGNMVTSGGTATYGINYYNLGKMAAEQAVEILVNGKDVATVPVGFAAVEDLEFAINEENCAAIGLEIPAELKK